MSTPYLPVFLFLHTLSHFSIWWRISSFLANTEFNVLSAKPRRFAMYTRCSPGFFSTSCIIFNWSCKVLTSLAEPWSKENKLNINKTIKLLKTNRNEPMKTNKPNTRNHTRKHRTTCNEVKFGNDANNVDAELRATCEAWLHYCVARFIVQREGNRNNKYFASMFFFKRSMQEILHRDHDLQTINAVKR